MRAQDGVCRVLIAAICLSTGTALAHGGGLDKCGGHKDKKRGGYHVHKVAKYCACNPKAAECTAVEKAPAKKKK